MRTCLKLAILIFLLLAVRLLFLPNDNVAVFAEKPPRASVGRNEVVPVGANPHPRIHRHLARVLSFLEATVDADTDAALISQECDRISPAELKQHLSLLEDNSTPAASDLRQVLARRWAQSDPRDAAAWAERREPDSVGFAAVVRQVALGWAGSDSTAAAQWVAGLKNLESRSDIVLAVAYEAADRQPLLALGIAGALPPEPQRDDLLEHAVRQWASSDAKGALRWAASTANHDLRQRLMAAVAVVMARSDEVSAAKVAVELIVPGEAQNRLAVGIVQHCAVRSPEFAAGWASRFPDPETRAAGARILISSQAGIERRFSPKWTYNPANTGILR